MTKRQKSIVRAISEREALIKRLGAWCRNCGRKSRLEVHHPNGRSYKLSALSYEQRVLRYKAEEKAGLLSVLCRKCNASDWN